jgi:hypothetical protein
MGKKPDTAGTVNITSPADGATVIRPFTVKGSYTNVTTVAVQIWRAGNKVAEKPATLSGGQFQTTFTVGDVSPTPAGQQDSLIAVGNGGGTVTSPTVHVTIQ